MRSNRPGKRMQAWKRMETIIGNASPETPEKETRADQLRNFVIIVIITFVINIYQSNILINSVRFLLTPSFFLGLSPLPLSQPHSQQVVRVINGDSWRG